MYFAKHWQDKNKALEIQSEVHDDTSTFFEVITRWDRNCDHAGFKFNLTVWKWCFCFDYYDTRHWDWDEERWMTPEDYLKELEDDWRNN